MSKLNFRNELRAFMEDFYKKPLGDLHDTERSKGLALYYITEIFNPLNNNLLGNDIDPYDIAENFYTDGAGDCGIDAAIHVDDTNFLFQFKYHSKGITLDEKEVAKFKKVVSRLHPDTSTEERKNRNIRDFLENIDWKKDNFNLIYIGLGKSNDAMRHEINEGLPPHENKKIQKILDHSEFKFRDESDLNIEVNSVHSIGEPLPDVKIRCRREDKTHKPWIKYERDEKYRTFLTMVDVNHIYEIYKNSNEVSLFNLNVRDFVGNKSKINAGIKNSYLNDTENFFFYNNGISAVARDIEEDEKEGILYCSKFSVVNGAQTLSTLAKAYDGLAQDAANSKKYKSTPVMMKITQITDLYGDGGRIASKITEYNNSQNAVKSSDFRTNDKIQSFIFQQFSKAPSYNGKKYYYKIKRGTTKKQKRDNYFVEFTDFCKIIYTYKFGCIEFFGGSPHLFDDDIKGGYFKLFGDPEDERIKSILSKHETKYFLSIYFLFEFVQNKFKEIQKKKIKEEFEKFGGDDEKTLYNKKVLNFYHIFFTLSSFFDYVSEKLGLSKDDFTIKYFAHPNWKDDEQKTKVVEKVIKLSCDELITQYMSSEKEKNFIHRNWYRKKSTMESIMKAPLGKSTTIEEIAEQFENKNT